MEIRFVLNALKHAGFALKGGTGVLPVIAQGQVGHILQSFERLRTDSTDLIPGYEQIPGVSRDPDRDTSQIFRDALHGMSRLGTLTTRRTRCVNRAEQRAENNALSQNQIQHVGLKQSVAVREWQSNKKKTQNGKKHTQHTHTRGRSK